MTEAIRECAELTVDQGIIPQGRAINDANRTTSPELIPEFEEFSFWRTTTGASQDVASYTQPLDISF
jgi:hypothetical protein